MSSLFDLLAQDPGLARNDHPATSHEAAAAIAPRAGTLRARVLVLLGDGIRCTAEEMEDRLALSGNTVRPRLVELRNLALVVQTEHRAKTRSGRDAFLWEITPKGLDALQEMESK